MIPTLLALLLSFPGFALAQGPGPQLIPDTGMIGSCSFVTGSFTFDCIPLYLAYLIRFAFSFAGGFALFEIIRGGYEYAMSGLQPIASGLPDKEAAKKRITNAILGLIVVVFAYLIVDTIVSFIFGA
jgi:dolichyl-phosphate-mannose--protein O-mannosyl transferase